MSSKPVSLFKNVGLIFFIVSGGAYGLESLVAAVGPAWALGLVALVPLIWVLPVSLMVVELSTALPRGGGYYYWVKRTLGPFWGFQEGWWTLCYSIFDLAIYPVLFVTYLGFFFPNLADPMTKWMISTAFVALSLLANALGLRWLGRQVIAQLLVVVAPFFILVLTGFWKSVPAAAALIPPAPAEPFGFAPFGAGLAIVLWNYCGWDNVSTYLHEVQDPGKTFARSMWVSVILVTAAYVLPVLVGIRFVPDPKSWGESSGWPAIAEVVSGHGLALWIAAGALISTSAQFSGQLLYLSRLGLPMVEDRTLPSFLSRWKNRNGEPIAMLGGLALMASLLSTLSLTKLVVIDILFYGMGLLLEFVALIRLRQKEPSLPRPFRIPFGLAGLCVLSALPVLCALTVAAISLREPQDRWQMLVVLALALVGFQLARKSSRKIESSAD